MRACQTTQTVLVLVAAMALAERAAAGETTAGIGTLRPGEMYSGLPAVSSTAPWIPLPGSFEAQAGDDGNGFQDWLWEYDLGGGLYAGLSGSYLWWMDRKVTFDTGDVRLSDTVGVTGEVGIRFNKFISLQASVTWLPDMYEEQDTGPMSGVDGHDGWMGGPAVLLHYPLWRFLPYVGAGGGAFERPESRGTDLGPMVFGEAGFRFFLNDYVAINADVKYVWAFLEDSASEDTADSIVGSIGLVLNLPFGM